MASDVPQKASQALPPFRRRHRRPQLSDAIDPVNILSPVAANQDTRPAAEPFEPVPCVQVPMHTPEKRRRHGIFSKVLPTACDIH